MELIRPDYATLEFKNFNEYQRSFLILEDKRYLQSVKATNILVSLGYRSTSRMYSESEFYKTKEKTMNMLNPRVKSTVMCGTFMVGNDPGLRALAEREKPNILQKLSTIIFIVVRQPSGFDVSGYMDFESSLRHYILNLSESTNWKGVFEGTVQLRPKPNHLSFYDQHAKVLSYNDSENYQIIHVGDSMMVKHKGDHKVIQFDTRLSSKISNCQRYTFHSGLGSVFILYDHIVRKPV